MVIRTMKALALLSGGLDSTLAIKVLLEQGLAVEAINFTSPFCLCSGSKAGCHAATAAADRLGVKLHLESCGQEYLNTIAKPKYGYGRQMNPCLDCRIFKLRRAKEKMHEIGASFLVTGEVLDQRPMSQRRDTLDICERDTGLRGLILRPLSAQVLRPTIPEEEGWVDRSKLLAIHGRGRGPQIALADKLGVADYPCPGGGCLLTYEDFAARVRDLLAHGERLTLWNTSLLRLGRHYRLPNGAKLIVGKNEGENLRLAGAVGNEAIVLESVSSPGPTALLYGNLDADTVPTAAGVVARYMDPVSEEPRHRVAVRRPGAGEPELLTVEALPPETVAAWLIGRTGKEKPKGVVVS